MMSNGMRSPRCKGQHLSHCSTNNGSFVQQRHGAKLRKHVHAALRCDPRKFLENATNDKITEMFLESRATETNELRIDIVRTLDGTSTRIFQ